MVQLLSNDNSKDSESLIFNEKSKNIVQNDN